jgi:hypothetical protein
MQMRGHIHCCLSHHIPPGLALLAESTSCSAFSPCPGSCHPCRTDDHTQVSAWLTCDIAAHWGELCSLPSKLIAQHNRHSMEPLRRCRVFVRRHDENHLIIITIVVIIITVIVINMWVMRSPPLPLYCSHTLNPRPKILNPKPTVLAFLLGQPSSSPGREDGGGVGPQKAGRKGLNSTRALPSQNDGKLTTLMPTMLPLFTAAVRFILHHPLPNGPFDTGYDGFPIRVGGAAKNPSESGGEGKAPRRDSNLIAITMASNNIFLITVFGSRSVPGQMVGFCRCLCCEEHMRNDTRSRLHLARWCTRGRRVPWKSNGPEHFGLH